MEAIILAGGKAERLGDAAGGRPKALVPVGGRPLAAYLVAGLAGAGVERVIVSCAAGHGGALRRGARAGRVSRSFPSRSPSRSAAAEGCVSPPTARQEAGPVFAAERRRARRRRLRGSAGAACASRGRGDDHRRAASVCLRGRRPRRGQRSRVRGSPAASLLGATAASTSSARRLSPACPSGATTSARRSPSSPPKASSARFRHEGVWLTVNTPKDLRTAEEYVAANPGWLAVA